MIADTITALLDGAAQGEGSVAFLDDDRVEIRFGELWRRAERAAAYFLDSAGAGGTVAVMMETSPDGLLLSSSVPDPDLRGAVSRLQNVRWAGQVLLPDDVRSMLDQAGFASVTIVSEPLADTMRFVAGRRVGSVARAPA